MTFPISPEEYLDEAEHSAHRRAALAPDMPMNRYSIAAMEVFEETMRHLAAGAGSFDELTTHMLRKQKALADLHGVEP